VARAGGDPIAERNKDRRTSITFEQAARKVHANHVVPHAKAAADWPASLEVHAFPIFGAKPVHAVDQSDVLAALAPIWATINVTARRVKQRIGTVLDWAKTAGHRGEGVNPVEGIERGLPKVKAKVEHFAALPWRELPALIARFERVETMAALALRFAILTAVRSGEVRGTTWREIDLEAAVWTIPAAKMKMDRPHRVPLSDAAVAALAEAKTLAVRKGALIFPSRCGQDRPLADTAFLRLLRELDVAATAHGFRSTFRDWAEEAVAFPHEVKEAALAHQVKDPVERAYRRTDLFEKRRDMMDAWARFATGGGKVVQLAAG